MPVLQMAIRHGHLKCAEALVQAGADIHALNMEIGTIQLICAHRPLLRCGVADRDRRDADHGLLYVVCTLAHST